MVPEDLTIKKEALFQTRLKKMISTLVSVYGNYYDLTHPKFIAKITFANSFAYLHRTYINAKSKYTDRGFMLLFRFNLQPMK